MVLPRRIFIAKLAPGAGNSTDIPEAEPIPSFGPCFCDYLSPAEGCDFSNCAERCRAMLGLPIPEQVEAGAGGDSSITKRPSWVDECEDFAAAAGGSGGGRRAANAAPRADEASGGSSNSSLMIIAALVGVVAVVGVAAAPWLS